MYAYGLLLNSLNTALITYSSYSVCCTMTLATFKVCSMFICLLRAFRMAKTTLLWYILVFIHICMNIQDTSPSSNILVTSYIITIGTVHTKCIKHDASILEWHLWCYHQEYSQIIVAEHKSGTTCKKSTCYHEFYNTNTLSKWFHYESWNVRKTKEMFTITLDPPPHSPFKQAKKKKNLQLSSSLFFTSHQPLKGNA